MLKKLVYSASQAVFKSKEGIACNNQWALDQHACGGKPEL